MQTDESHPCAILLCGYCMSHGSPLSSIRLLLLHALYRPVMELGVRKEVANLTSGNIWLWGIHGKKSKQQYWYNLNCLLFKNIFANFKKEAASFWVVVVFFFLQHPFQRRFSPSWVDMREKPSAAQTLIPTVKSGSHQTWSCPQHASRISLFVLQIPPCFTHGCRDYSTASFHSHTCGVFGKIAKWTKILTRFFTQARNITSMQTYFAFPPFFLMRIWLKEGEILKTYSARMNPEMQLICHFAGDHLKTPWEPGGVHILNLRRVIFTRNKCSWTYAKKGGVVRRIFEYGVLL